MCPWQSSVLRNAGQKSENRMRLMLKIKKFISVWKITFPYVADDFYFLSLLGCQFTNQQFQECRFANRFRTNPRSHVNTEIRFFKERPVSIIAKSDVMNSQNRWLQWRMFLGFQFFPSLLLLFIILNWLLPFLKVSKLIM